MLTDFYVANTACTPSRAALLTGTYAHRIGMDGGKLKVTFPGDSRGLNPNEITIAEMLRENGYATGCFGKWHLGDQPQFMPLAQGFDTYFGIPYSNDMWPLHTSKNPITKRKYEPLPVMRQPGGGPCCGRGGPVSAGGSHHRRSDCLHEENQALLCYIPHAHVHKPRHARPEYLKRAEGNVDRAHVEEVDDSVACPADPEGSQAGSKHPGDFYLRQRPCQRHEQWPPAGYKRRQETRGPHAGAHARLVAGTIPAGA